MAAWDTVSAWNESGRFGVLPWDRGDNTPPVAPASWTLVYIPDSQNFFEYDKEERFQDQINWTVANKDAYNIKHLAHVGDIIASYSVVGVSEPDWVAAKTSMDYLTAAGIPYSATVGNHDLAGGARNSDMFNYYFPLNPTFTTQSTFGGYAEANKSENTYHTFTVGDTDWLIISLEFGPRAAIISWANDVVTAHPNHRVIVVTHAYVSKTGDLLSSGQNHSPDNGYGLGADVYNGDEMWDGFVKLHSNILMVLSGHDGQPSPLVNAKRLDDFGVNGNRVYQFLFNWQYDLTNNGRMMIIQFTQAESLTMEFVAYNATTQTISSDPNETFTIVEGPAVVITSPADGTVTNTTPIAVAWTVDGVSQSTQLTANLTEGANTITRSYTDGNGVTGSDSVSVTLDTVAPVVVITSPADAAELTESSVAVAWTVDGVSQSTELVETLEEGENLITRSYTDAAGNVGSDSVTVNYTPSGVFSPTDDPGLYAWYYPNNAATTTESGGAVSAKASEVAGAYTLSQATGTAQPVNTGSLNGKIIFNYDGGDSLGRGGTYNATTNPYIANGSFHLIMLFRINSAGVDATTDGLMRINTATGFAITANNASAFPGRVTAYGTIGFSSTSFNAGSNLNDDNYHILRVVADAANTSFKVWVDGTLRMSSSAYNGAIQSTDFQVFLGRNAGNNLAGGHGDIIFTTDLSDLIYASYVSYINNEYATTF